jgi:hypothetical protein
MSNVPFGKSFSRSRSRADGSISARYKHTPNTHTHIHTQKRISHKLSSTVMLLMGQGSCHGVVSLEYPLSVFNKNFTFKRFRKYNWELLSLNSWDDGLGQTSGRTHMLWAPNFQESLGTHERIFTCSMDFSNVHTNKFLRTGVSTKISVNKRYCTF